MLRQWDSRPMTFTFGSSMNSIMDSSPSSSTDTVVSGSSASAKTDNEVHAINY